MKSKKRFTALLFMLGLFAATSATAQMVDVGMGKMQQSEFDALKAMVRGQPPVSQSNVATSVEKRQPYGMVEMTPEAFDALRDQVAGRGQIGRSRLPPARPQRVDIGTGMMDANEFRALKQIMDQADSLICRPLVAGQR